uniref:Uncharacterized protein n=1 Tax=Euplotes harpa TaxID=151035 RepID=A0A7S3NCJ4_9SPIT|mmetsp:Transcript_3696/g.4518  ORF Transcript_3696/g.4518 Transcript_3696/m.4518 type:complete len:162 (+) Transcript_3696:273-758(+)
MFEDIKEEIDDLTLIKIYDKEVVYKEKQKDLDRFRSKQRSNKEYTQIVFTTDSYLSHFLYPRARATKLLFFSKRMKYCTHKYSCFERVCRVFGAVFGTYSLARSIWNYMFSDEKSSEGEESTLLDSKLFSLVILSSVIFLESCIFSVINDWTERKKRNLHG